MDDALGEGYDYWKSIKSPSELGMSGAPSIETLADDVSGMIAYVEVLITGRTKASRTGEPLGNKFFLKTMASCRNIMSDRTKEDSESNPIIVPRYIHVDNVPDGTIPFITSGVDGAKLSEFSGLIPGAVGNLSSFSPSGFGRAFTMGNYPDCMQITLQTVNNNNEEGSETQYVAVSDILNEVKSANMVSGNPVTSDIDPCRFKDYTHPVTKVKKTKEVCEPEPDTFTSLRQSSSSGSDSESDSESDSSSSSDSDSSSDVGGKKDKKKNDKNKKQKDKKEKKDKNEKKNKTNDKNNAAQYDPASSAGGMTYDSMSITNDTMFDDVSHITENALKMYRIPDDTPTRIYYAAITAIGLYLLYRLLEKKQK